MKHKETGGNAMTATVKRIVLGLAAALVALGAVLPPGRRRA
jgi:hypothetical protein